jgi:steroid 5-alpha reductase family enzyme
MTGLGKLLPWLAVMVLAFAEPFLAWGLAVIILITEP